MSPSSNYSVLVVDDEPDLRTLYELTLLREGYDIETAGTVEDALAHLKERAYHAVITDMRLPDGSGLDVLHWLEENGRREKTVVITAYGSSENAVEALKSGAYDYLTKPVDLKQFRAVVASALGRGGSVAPAPTESASLPPLPGTPRGPTSWIARATSSLPVPDSPLTSTGAMLRATFSTSERTCCIAIDWPAMRASAALTGAGGGAGAARGVRGVAGPRCSDGNVVGSTVGAAAPPRPSAEATTPRNCFRSTGLVR